MRSITQRYQFLFRFFTTTTSLAAIFAGAIAHFPSNVYNTIFISIGTSLLAGTIASVFDSVFLPKSLDLALYQPETQGIKACYPSVNDIMDQDDFPIRLQNARTIDFIFNSGSSVLTHYRTQLQHALESAGGCKVRFIISNPDNKIFEDRGANEGFCSYTTIPSEVRSTQRQMRASASGLIASSRSTLEMRLAACVITASFIIVDNELIRMTPYVPYEFSSAVPVFDIIKGNNAIVFGKYHGLFKKIWDHDMTAKTDVLFPKATLP